MKKIRLDLVTPLPWHTLSNCFQDEVQKIPTKISCGYPGVKVVIKQSVLLYKNLFPKVRVAVQKAGNFCVFDDILYCSGTHSIAYMSWKTAVVYHVAMRKCDCGIFLCNFVVRNVTNS